MTTRQLPRTARGLALPRSDTDTASWPPVLRGRSTLLCMLMAGWLGGGLLATAVALVTTSPNDLMYGLTNTAAALVGLLLLVAVSARDASRRRRRSGLAAVQPVPVPVTAQVPAQADPVHDDQPEPALR
jgi:hypothetical protein